MMYRIESVAVFRSAAILASLIAALYAALLGLWLVVLAVGWIIGRLPAAAHGPSAPLWVWLNLPLVLPVIFAIAWLIFLPLMALFCYCYNQAAKVTGGIEFTAD
jgi:hypothetical protein